MMKAGRKKRSWEEPMTHSIGSDRVTRGDVVRAREEYD
jgi:hypothetical protein